MERAAELLRSGRYNVTEAATEVGYSSLSHFSKAFCETIGCCPVLYPMAKNVDSRSLKLTPKRRSGFVPDSLSADHENYPRAYFRFRQERHRRVCSRLGKAAASISFPLAARRNCCAKEKVPVREISKFTDFPEVLEGRVKTLHPRVHGGLLYKRGNPKHETEAREQGFQPIDLVVVNLYPFEATIAKPDVTLAEAIEQIDIGGPSMIRSAAKNYESVTVVVDPADYDEVLENIRDHDGETTLKLRERLAIKAFIKTSEYDRAIANFLNQEQKTDASFSIALPLATRLRYGENPHQTAALYGNFDRAL